MYSSRSAVLLGIATARYTSNHTINSLTSGTSASDRFEIGYYNGSNYRKSYKSDFEKFHGNPNIFLGLAMLLVIGTIVCLICYCCHRKSKMRSSLYMQHRWYDRADSNIEIYSVEQYFDITTINERGDEPLPMRIVNELPPSYHDCIRTLSVKSQTLYDARKFAKSDTIKPSIDDDRLNNNIVNENVSSTRVNNDDNAGNYAAATTSDANGNIVSTEGNALDMINGKGVIKLDMSRIMDPTGLPTYEAALKLKSSTYI